MNLGGEAVGDRSSAAMVNLGVDSPEIETVDTQNAESSARRG